MKRLTRFLIAALLATAALFSAAPNVSAIDWCQVCAETGGCWECCRCGGGTPNACIRACGF
jgi:hypothetical protein